MPHHDAVNRVRRGALALAALLVTTAGAAHAQERTQAGHAAPAGAPGQTPPEQGTPAPQPAVADTPAIGIVGEEALRQFVGEYELGPGAVFKVDSVQGALVLTTSIGIESPLVHESGATYAVPAIGLGTAITFLADVQGRVVGFQVRYEGDSNRRLRKIR